MEALELLRDFIQMVKLLFTSAKVCVNINGIPSKSFMIERGVRQGCPLASYLFLIAVNVINTMFMKEARMVIIKRIQLPTEQRQQIMAQYPNHNSLILRKRRKYTISNLYSWNILLRFGSNLQLKQIKWSLEEWSHSYLTKLDQWAKHYLY